jgi:hypothetical protein
MSKVRALALGLGILLLLALVISYIGGQDNEGSSLSTRVTVQPGDTLIQQVSSMMPQQTLQDLILRSEAMVIGTVTDILPAKRGVVPGEIPIIYTDVILEVDRYLFGEPESKRIAVRVWGGRIGNTIMLDDNAAVFTLGEHIVGFLFRAPYEVVPPDGIDALSYYEVSCGCLGKFAYEATGLVNNGWVEDFPGQVVAISAIEKQIAEIRG